MSSNGPLETTRPRPIHGYTQVSVVMCHTFPQACAKYAQLSDRYWLGLVAVGGGGGGIEVSVGDGDCEILLVLAVLGRTPPRWIVILYPFRDISVGSVIMPENRSTYRLSVLHSQISQTAP